MELVIQQKKNAREKSRRDVVDWLRFQRERLFRLHRPDRIAVARRKQFNPLAEEEAVKMDETRAD